MKLIFALAAAGFISTLTVPTPASAQKDPACIEKCNRDNKVAGGGAAGGGGRHAGGRIGACIQTCPAAKIKAK